MGLRPREQLVGVRGRARHAVRHVFEQRPGRRIREEHAVPLGQAVHQQRGGHEVLLVAGERHRVVGRQPHPNTQFDAGRKRVGSRKNDVDVERVRGLFGFDFARQLGRGAFAVRHVRDVCGNVAAYLSIARWISANEPPTSMTLRVTGLFGIGPACPRQARLRDGSRPRALGRRGRDRTVDALFSRAAPHDMGLPPRHESSIYMMTI